MKNKPTLLTIDFIAKSNGFKNRDVKKQYGVVMYEKDSTYVHVYYTTMTVCVVSPRKSKSVNKKQIIRREVDEQTLEKIFANPWDKVENEYSSWWEVYRRSKKK